MRGWVLLVYMCDNSFSSTAVVPGGMCDTTRFPQFDNNPAHTQLMVRVMVRVRVGLELG